MVLCREKSSNYLARLGVNTIRYPTKSIKPLTLIGEQGGEVLVLGTITDLCLPNADPSGLETHLAPAPNIVGKNTSKIPAEFGIDIVKHLIYQLGLSFSTNTSLSSASTVQFEYRTVSKSSITPLAIGKFLSDSEINWRGPVLSNFVFGSGSLHIVREAYQCNSLLIKAFSNNGKAIDLKGDALNQATASASIEANVSGELELKYEGDDPLSFAFAADEYFVDHDDEKDELTIKFSANSLKRTALSGGAPSQSVTSTFYDRYGVLSLKT